MRSEGYGRKLGKVSATDRTVLAVDMAGDRSECFRKPYRLVTEQERFSGVSRPLSNGQNGIGEIMRRFPR